MKDFSIKYKIIFTIFFINFLVIIIGMTVIITRDIDNFKTEALNNAVLHSKLIGQHSLRSLKKNDKKEVKNILENLKFVKMVKDVRLYNAEKEIISIYSNYGDFEFFLFDFSKEGLQQISDDYILVSEPIFEKNKIIAYIHLTYSTINLNNKIKSHLETFIIIAFFMILLSLILSLWSQSFIIKPILQLTKFTKKISNISDYSSFRLKEYHNNEFSVLYSSFNKMLNKLEERRNKHLSAERFLKQSKEQFEKITSFANDTIFMINKNADIVFWNKAAEKLFGYKNEEILKKKFYILLLEKKHKLILKKTFSNLEKLKRRKRNYKNLEFFLRKKNFKKILVSTSIATTYINGDWHLIVILRDITKQRKFEINLRETKEKAEESDKLKSFFLANISHEIRTPMNAIIGFSDILAMPNFPEKDRKKYISYLKESTNTLLQLIDNIMDLSKIEAGQIKFKKEKFTVSAILKEEINLLKIKKEKENKNLELIIKINDNVETLSINSDKVRIKQVIKNLLNNAFKFTEKGKIEISFFIKNENCLQFSVKDTGIGIKKEHTNIIFIRFRKVEENVFQNYQGAGLGLTISKKIIELLGGKMWLTSEINKGSTFYFTIPI